VPRPEEEGVAEELFAAAGFSGAGIAGGCDWPEFCAIIAGTRQAISGMRTDVWARRVNC